MDEIRRPLDVDSESIGDVPAVAAKRNRKKVANLTLEVVVGHPTSLARLSRGDNATGA
jgi:hypothetical protein